MSRGQQGQVYDTAQSQNQTYNSNANTAFNNAQTDINNYASANNNFSAANPYVQGGVVQTAQNQETADTAAGQAEAAGQALQSAAVRTGQNAGGAIAATENMQEQNERNLIGQEAANTASRAASGAQYSGQVLTNTGNIENMQDQLATQQAQAAQGTLSTEEQAAQTPSFLDELGQGLVGSVGQVGSAAIGKFCYIAAALYGGWDDPRTKTVQDWLATVLLPRWYGPAVLAAYAVWGARVAEEMQQRRWLKAILQRVFDNILVRAEVVSHG